MSLNDNLVEVTVAQSLETDLSKMNLPAKPISFRGPHDSKSLDCFQKHSANHDVEVMNKKLEHNKCTPKRNLEPCQNQCQHVNVMIVLETPSYHCLGKVGFADKIFNENDSRV